MPATTIDELQVLFSANKEQLTKDVEKVKKDIAGVQTQAESSSSGALAAFQKFVKGLKALGITAVIMKIFKVVKDSIKSALDYIAGDQVYQATMGQWQAATKEFTEDLKQKLGISRSEMRQFISVLYNMLQPMGIASDRAFTMSKSLAMLSQDMAAFWNISTDDALNAFQSGLAGNSQALRRYGINISDTMIREVAYRNGIAQTGSQLTEQQKVMARYCAIMEQTANMQGFLARTIDAPNAQMRILADSIKTLQYSFGQLFIPAISAALPVLNALVKLATMAITAIGTLFGLLSGGKGSPGKSLNSGMAQVEVSSGGVADNLGAAGGAAKKLKQTLASFDEMNVLQEPDTGGGGGGGGGSGAGANMDFALPEYDFSALDGITSKADKIINYLQGLFSGIDTERLTTSFVGFGKSIGEMMTTLGGFGIWLLENILAPIGVWFTNNVIPPVLDTISASVESCTVFFQMLADVLEPLWTNIFAPLGGFLGAILEPVLRGVSKGALAVAEAFKEVAKWVKDNSEKLDEFLSPVKDWLEKAASWVRENDKLNAVLEALGFALGALAVIIAVVIVVQTTLALVTGVATTVMGAFSAVIAFITSPIGLAILAITALIAIGVLLYQNWEKVKEFAGSLWTAIKETFSKIGEHIGNIFKGIVNAGISMVNFLIGAVETLINGFLTPLNAAIKAVNVIPGVNIPTLSVSIPRIPRLAEGGIVDRATLAIVGEAGREAVLPLENNTGWMDRLAERIGLAIENDDGQPIHVTVNIGEDTIIERVIDGINESQFRRGGEVFG
ncbi:MAG: hypothetical protein FWD45_00270 [Coriobacteriia bacterium]|nr:hypothetical protein [Coriobacteriia bacterium]